MLTLSFSLHSSQRLRRPHLQSGPRPAGGRDCEREFDGADDYGWGDFAEDEDVRVPLRGFREKKQRGKRVEDRSLLFKDFKYISTT